MAQHRRSGFMLIEIIVSLLIIAGILAAVSSMVGMLDSNDLRGEAAKLTNTIEAVYGRAAINGRRYQMVFDLDEGVYWAECSDEAVPLPGEMLSGSVGEFGQAPVEHEGRFYEADDEQADPFGYSLSNRFDDCEDPLVRRHTLDDDVIIRGVMTTHQEDPFESGVATIGFFPNGFVEQSIIWVGAADGDATMSLFVDSITGQVTVRVGYQEVPDEFLDIEEAR